MTTRNEKWRIGANDAKRAVEMSSDVPFDELCIGEWFHLERMSTSGWMLIVGETHFAFDVSAKGKVRATLVEGPLKQ